MADPNQNLRTPIQNKSDRNQLADLSQDEYSDVPDEDVPDANEFVHDPFLDSLQTTPRREFKSPKPKFSFSQPMKTRKPKANKFGKSKPVNRASYGRMEDIRKHDTVPDPELYDQMINIILNAKKDIKFSPSAETRTGAERYAKSHGLRLGKAGEDINGDGVEDVVLYNKMGYPVVINGYHLKPSKLPLRQMYKQKYQTAADRYDVGGFKGFINHEYGADSEFDDEGKRRVRYSKDNLPPAFGEMKDQGWHIPAVPRRELTFRQIAMKVLAYVFKEMAKYPAVASKSWTLKCISRISLFSIVYSIVVEKKLIEAYYPQLKEEIRNKSTDAKSAMENFNRWKAANKEAIKKIIDANKEAIVADLRDPVYLQQCLDHIGISFYIEQDTTPTNEQFEALSQHDKLVYKDGLKRTLDAALADFKDELPRILFMDE